MHNKNNCKLKKQIDRHFRFSFCLRQNHQFRRVPYYQLLTHKPQSTKLAQTTTIKLFGLFHMRIFFDSMLTTICLPNTKQSLAPNCHTRATKNRLCGWCSNYTSCLIGDKWTRLSAVLVDAAPRSVQNQTFYVQQIGIEFFLFYVGVLEIFVFCATNGQYPRPLF